MFSEGLDKSALRWVREGSVNQKKEVSCAVGNLRSQTNPVSNTRNGGRRRFGLPPPSKFQSGHLSGAIPVSRAIPAGVDDSGSASENSLTTDDDEEVYGIRYSLDSSPQDDRVSSNAAAQIYYNAAQRRPYYASDSMYSGDVSSSRETLGEGHGNLAERLMRGASRYPVGMSSYAEDESSDSATSSEFSATQAVSNNGALPLKKAFVSEGCASSIHQSVNEENASERVCKATCAVELPSCAE